MFNILFSHTDFYVVEKPANVSFHSEQETGFFALLCQQISETLYPVHRLDKVTSGLVIVARNKNSAALFGDMFAQKDKSGISKFYLAVAMGKPSKKQGWVKGDLVKSRRGCYKLQKTQQNPSITRFQSTLIEPGLRLYLLQPVTGKTHQLRVVLKSLSTPILGDERYGGEIAERAHLHAYALRFMFKGQQFQFILPPSGGVFNHDKCKSLLEQWQQPWTAFN